MGGFVRKVTGAPNRKDTAAILSGSTGIKAIEPPKELAAPTLADAAPAAEEERKKNKRQAGRASTVFGGALGDDSLQGSTAKATLGA